MLVTLLTKSAHRLRRLVLVCTLLCGAGVAAVQQHPTFGGTWTATVGQDRVLRGRWIGQMVPGEPDSAHGSWILVNKSGKTVTKGTWSARKVGREWRGTWSATDQAQRPAKGTWTAEIKINPQSPLDSMLELSVKEEVSGTWMSGRLSGFWWIEGERSTQAH